MSGLGLKLKDDAFNKVFEDVSQGKGAVSSTQYIAYLTELSLDKDTPEQLKEAFRTLAEDGASISAQQLQVGDISAGDVEYLTHVMPAAASGTGFDYNAFVDASFVK